MALNVTQRALLLINRHSRRGQEGLPKAIECLRSRGFELIEESSAKPDSLPNLIRQYREQVDLVIIGGGDGTINAAADGLIDTQLPLGVLPLGTANDLARTLKLPNTLEAACEVIAAGQLQAIDLGWVNGKHFFNVASLGLSVRITERLNREAKRRWGVLAYAMTAAQVMFQSRPFFADVWVDGAHQRVRTVQIAVGNGRHYGGGLTVAEDAAIDDQRLDVYSLEVDHWWQMLALLPGMRSGTHASWSFVHALRGQEVEVRTRRSYAINTDGELTTFTPARFRVVPAAIRVFVPSP